MRQILVIVSGLLALAGSASAQPQGVRIVDIGHSGPGCPQSSPGISLSLDRNHIVATFTDLIAQTTPSGPSIARTNCQLRLTVEVDPGWQFGLSSVEYRGFASLEPDVIGQQTSTYFFAGMPPNADAKAATTIHGPYSGNYARTDTIDMEIFSPCGQSRHELIINNDTRVRGHGGVMTVDSLTGTMRVDYHLRWRQCQGSARHRALRNQQQAPHAGGSGAAAGRVLVTRLGQRQKPAPNRLPPD